MKVLVTGASGFVGAKIVSDLLKLGHQVTCCVRDTDYTQRLFPKAEILYCDFIHDTKIENWLPRLKNINVVINTVGIFYHPRKKIIWAIHYDTPHALFDACVISGVKKIIHISALGVDYYDTEYARSKKAIDDYLLTLSIPVIILRPSLIYGNGSYGGTSLFRGLVGLPVIIPLPGHGQQKLQPILCADLSIAISNLMTKPTEGTFILSAVSKEIISIKEILMTLREWLGFSQAYLVAIPKIIIRIVCLVGDLIPNTTMNSTAYKMLMQNNISNPIDTNKFIEIIQFQPLNFNSGAFHEPSTVQDRWHAKLYFIKPLLQISLALMWLFAGLTSLFFFPKTNSYLLLEKVGFAQQIQPLILYSASFLDIFIGLALLFNIQIKKICLLQIIVMLIYMTIISFFLPYLWLDPFGAILKNIPLLIAIYMLYIMESKR